MPNDNSTQQTTNDGQQPSATFPSVSVEDTLPPTITTTTVAAPSVVPQDTVNPSPANSTPSDTGSAAPNNDLAMSGVVGTTPPKKKFAGGKIIATILGLFLLVGGVGAGVFLTGQNQDIREKAATNNWRSPCTVNGCTAKDYPTTWVNHWRCLDIVPPNGNCSDIEVAIGVKSASFQFNCGTEQIDSTEGSPPGFTSIRHDQPCESGGGNLACVPLINIYNSDWVKVNDPSTLAVGTTVYVGIIDRYGTKVFDKARFTVNEILKPETSAKKEVFITGTSGPKMTVLYDNLTVAAGTTNIFAEVYFAGAWYGK